MSAPVQGPDGRASGGHHKRVRFAFLAVIALGLLAGCGGGGGSPAPVNTIDQSVQLELSMSQVSATAQLSDSPPTAFFQASVQANTNAPTGKQYYIAASTTHNGIDTFQGAADGAFDDITLTFKSPASLGIGTYLDTVTLKACDDQACTRQVGNSPQTVTVTYVVTAQFPQLYSISPASITAGAAAFTIALSGNNFQAQSTVFWNGSPLTTTYVSADLLTAKVAAANVGLSGSYPVTVSNSQSLSSNAVNFTVTPLPALALRTISPNEVPAGGTDFMLAAVGTGFTATASIAWNGTNLPTTYISSTLLRAKVSAAQIASTGTVAVAVADTGAQGTSAAQNLRIVAPSVDSVGYQMNAAHSGAVLFKNLVLPANSAWSVDVGGNASYALIAGGHVIVAVAVNGNSQLLAMSGATGATLWGPVAFSGAANTAYDRGRVFVVSGSAQSQTISAVDATNGAAIWTTAVGGGSLPLPPVAADGIVYTTNGGLVTAFDETNGAILWQTAFSGTSGIVAATLDGLYGAAPCTALDLQPAVGTTLWSNSSGCSSGSVSTPVVANALVYVPNSSAGSSGTIFDAETGVSQGTYAASTIPAFSAISGFFLTNGTLQGLTMPDNQALWSFSGDGRLSTAPIVVNNEVFIGSTSGNLYALDATNGHPIWNKNLGAAIPTTDDSGVVQYSGLAAGDGLLVVPNGTKVTAFVLSTNP